jgi:heptosyltransferase II
VPPEPTHILVFIPNWLGDVVMATPALRALRNRFLDATITVAGKAVCCEILEDFPGIDQFVSLPNRPGLFSSFSLAGSLRDPRPDLAVVMPNSPRAAWLAWLSGARQRIGYARGGRGILLSHAIPRYREQGKRVPRYTALEYLALAQSLGADDDGAGLALAADARERAAVRACLEPGRPVVGIAPGAAFGPSKQWLPERFAAVADQLHEECDAQCVLLTGPGEEATRDAVVKVANTRLITCNQDDSSIARLKATMAEIDLLIGNDSGPRHIAIAFSRPVICVMGSTSPRYTQSPWEKGEVLRVDVDCGPCQKPHCSTDHRCMTGVSVERVVNAAKAWLPGSVST